MTWSVNWSAIHLKPRKLLIISYLFPPMGGIGVQRAISLCKYLPQHGFDIHVLTASNAGGPVVDKGLLRLVPASVTVHSAFTPEIPFALRHRIWGMLRGEREAHSPASPSSNQPGARPVSRPTSLPTRIAQRLLCPEPEVMWIPFALSKARKIIREHGIDCVLVTAPPFSAFIAGTQLKQDFPQIAYIADFRDEWLTFYINNNEFQNNPHARRRAVIIERETVEAADLVVAVNESSLEEIRKRYPQQDPLKFQCVPNGYDPDVFADFQPRSHGTKDLLITHVGTVHGTATARFFVQALHQLPSEIRSRIKARFVGRIIDTERSWLAQQGDSIEVLGFIPQKDAVRHMEDCDFLLMTMTDNLSMPGKFYEYLATGKPILAIASRNSIAHRTMLETGAGWCAEPDDPEGIQRMILRAFDAVSKRPFQWKHDPVIVRDYQRPALVARYAELIGRCSSLAMDAVQGR